MLSARYFKVHTHAPVGGAFAKGNSLAQEEELWFDISSSPCSRGCMGSVNLDPRNSYVDSMDNLRLL